jgi:hypothetical protein
VEGLSGSFAATLTVHEMGRPRRASGWGRACAVALLCVGSAAAAQALSDDLESGTLLTTDMPPGHWTQKTVTSAGSSVAVDTAARHRGNEGLRVVDNDADAGVGQQDNVLATVAGGSQDLYLRFWMRLTSSNQLGSFYLGGIGATLPTSGTLISSVSHVFGTGSQLSGFDRSGNWTGVAFTNVDWGQWHLVDLSARGIGTGAGARTVWVDGVQVGQQAGQDWSADQAVSVSVGELWSDDGRFMGTIDFDDIRLGPTPNASVLDIDAGSGDAPVGACLPAIVSLKDSNLALAPAPYDVPVLLDVPGAVPVNYFANPACQSSISLVILDAGTSQATVFFATVSPGMGMVEASYVDFISGFALLSAVGAPDAGQSDGGQGDAGSSDGGTSDGGTNDGGSSDGGSSDAGHSPAEPDAGSTEHPMVGNYLIDCGCNTSAAPFLGLALLALAGNRRRAGKGV